MSNDDIKITMQNASFVVIVYWNLMELMLEDNLPQQLSRPGHRGSARD